MARLKCPTKKQCYPSEADAEHALEVIRWWGVPWHRERRPYLCNLCGLWHLTSQKIKTPREEN